MLLVDPTDTDTDTDTDTMRAAIERVATGTDLREQLVTHGRQNLLRFDRRQLAERSFEYSREIHSRSSE